MFVSFSIEQSLHCANIDSLPQELFTVTLSGTLSHFLNYFPFGFSEFCLLLIDFFESKPPRPKFLLRFLWFWNSHLQFHCNISHFMIHLNFWTVFYPPVNSNLEVHTFYLLLTEPKLLGLKAKLCGEISFFGVLQTNLIQSKNLDL